jgi:hypothetical protein
MKCNEKGWMTGPHGQRADRILGQQTRSISEGVGKGEGMMPVDAFYGSLNL